MDPLSLVWKLVEKMFEWFGVPLARFILPPPHMEIERRLSYCGRHNTETGPFGLFIRMRFFNKSGRATVVESIQLFFAGTEGDPRRDGPYHLLTNQGWVIDGFLSREDNILVTRDVPPMKEVERFSYFWLPVAPDACTKLTVKATFVGRRSREATFTLAELG